MGRSREQKYENVTAEKHFFEHGWFIWSLVNKIALGLWDGLSIASCYSL